MLRSDRLSEAALAAINAPFEPGGWRVAIEKAAIACGASGANLVGIGGPLGLPLNLVSGRDGETASRHFANPRLWGPCNWRVNTAGEAGVIVHEPHYQAYRAVVDTSDYDDGVADVDMMYGCQTVFVCDRNSFVGLALLRGRADGPCDAEALDQFGRLIPEIDRAVRVQQALADEVAEMIVGSVDRMRSAIILLDRFGHVNLATQAAERLTFADGPLRIADSLIQLADQREDRYFQKALTRLLSAGQDPSGMRLHEMPIGRCETSPEGRWLLAAFRLPSIDQGLGFAPHIALSFQRLRPPD